MKIVAFLQNPWFPEGTQERHIQLYKTDQKFHQEVLSRTMTGLRLSRAFGELFSQIWWDNANWRPAHVSEGIRAADMAHVREVISTQAPKLLLAFGRIAQEAVDTAYEFPPYRVMHCHHPNARKKTQADLDMFATLVRKAMHES